MSTEFDPSLVEHTVVLKGRLVHVYKVGGGTPGRRYDGLWGYRVRCQGRLVASGEDLRTGMPKTHDEAALIALELVT
ncbi:hypothetical protein [Brevibacterium oceani]|uniref:hypothetical protein n=1 Tax=Brevibacterium oceani TaxID=358099 RepID=UPI0015E6C11A|nr:hypothetical protein [Brevibacterium oceani]